MKMMMILMMTESRSIAIRCYTDLEATQVINGWKIQNMFSFISEQILRMWDGHGLCQDS